MVNLRLAVFVSLMFVDISSALLADFVKEFHFMKIENGNEFKFEYKLDNGILFASRTYNLTERKYFMFGADHAIYWVDFTKDELDHQNSLSKNVRLVEHGDGIVLFKDDFFDYMLDISSGDLSIPLYATQWNVKNICFEKSKNEEKTFHYTILSDNNSRKYNGTTSYDVDDPMVQRIHLLDMPQLDGQYEVDFTDVELQSSETFCKGISKVIGIRGSLGVAFATITNQSLLKRLGEENKLFSSKNKTKN